MLKSIYQISKASEKSWRSCLNFLSHQPWLWSNSHSFIHFWLQILRWLECKLVFSCGHVARVNGCSDCPMSVASYNCPHKQDEQWQGRGFPNYTKSLITPPKLRSWFSRDLRNYINNSRKLLRLLQTSLRHVHNNQRGSYFIRLEFVHEKKMWCLGKKMVNGTAT